jgi:hypothetical protein
MYSSQEVQSLWARPGFYGVSEISKDLLRGLREEYVLKPGAFDT